MGPHRAVGVERRQRAYGCARPAQGEPLETGKRNEGGLGICEFTDTALRRQGGWSPVGRRRENGRLLFATSASAPAVSAALLWGWVKQSQRAALDRSQRARCPASSPGTLIGDPPQLDRKVIRNVVVVPIVLPQRVEGLGPLTALRPGRGAGSLLCAAGRAVLGGEMCAVAVLQVPVW